jgi:hypothetical protein
LKDIPRHAQVELFAQDEEQTKSIIDDVLFKHGVSMQKTIPTSEQYDDLVPVTKGKLGKNYYHFLKEKYGWKWTKDNVFGGNLGEMNAYETDLSFEDEENIKVAITSKAKKTIKEEDDSIRAKPYYGKNKINLENNGLGESYKFSQDGLSHIFLMFAKGVIPKISPEQLSLIYLELYGRPLDLETCEKLVPQINEAKTKLVHTAFTEQIGDSVLLKNALGYLQSKAVSEGWTEERLTIEARALKLVAKDLENKIGVTLGRSWVHDDCKESKESSLRKTFNFISKNLDKIITGSVRDISDVDIISRKK